MTGRRILVTGGSRGIAAAIACGLAAEGATIGLNYAAVADDLAGVPTAARELSELTGGYGENIFLLEQELGLPGAGQRLADRAEAEIGPLDGLVLSASAQVDKPLVAQSAEDVDRQIRLNLDANIELLQALLPRMADRGFGRVLSIGSVQEVAPSPDMPVYAMTKAALRNLFEAQAVHFAPRGVTLNTLSPGLITTDRNAHRRSDPAAWDRIQRRANPMGRAGTPQDLIGTALHLLSRDAEFVTGTTVYVTGGAHIPRAGTEEPRDAAMG